MEKEILDPNTVGPPITQQNSSPSSGLEVFKAPGPSGPDPIQSSQAGPSGSPMPSTKPQIPKKLLFIAIGTLSIIIIGSALVLGLNNILFNLSTLNFVPHDAEFYLGISVRNHPQVQKLKELTNKFPGGEKITEMQNMFRNELFGTLKDPFEDIVRLAQTEIFLAKVSQTGEAENPSGTMMPERTRTTNGGLETLLSVVDLESSKKAGEKLNNFKEDKDIYSTSGQTFEKNEIFNIKLNEKGRSSDQYPLGSLPLGVTLPYSQSVYASVVDKFILSSEKLDDIKNSISLSKKAGLFSFLNGNKNLKSILSNLEHKKISKYFPDEYLLKFYQQKPLEPFSNLIPISSLSQSFLLGYDSLNQQDGKNSMDVSRGLVITAHDDGIRMNSYQLDWRTPNESLKNPYKISESLAARLPQKFSGVTPAIFAETKNFKQLMSDQEEMLNEVADKSDNRNQRESFKSAVEGLKNFKTELRKTFGIDPDKDLFSWMEGNIAFIFNAGTKNKAPESLIVADTKNQKEVEDSLKKVKIPNYQAESEQRQQTYRDSSRRYNLQSLSRYLTLYYQDNQKYPVKLDDLVPKYVYSAYSLEYYSKDPKTKKSYKYTVGSGQTSYQLEASLEDGRKYVVTSTNTYGSYVGTAKPNEKIKPIEATSTNYKGSKIYSLPISTVGKTKFSMFFIITNKVTAILFSDSAQSIKDIVDFEEKPSDTLSSREAWKNQFEGISENVGGLVYIEPIAFLGAWDYYNNLYPEYGRLVGEESDIEVVLRAYLSTLKSIGTVVAKEKSVYATKTFVNIIELPSDQKSKAEDALYKLLDQTSRNSRFLLGAFNINWSESFKNLRDFIFP